MFKATHSSVVHILGTFHSVINYIRN